MDEVVVFYDGNLGVEEEIVFQCHFSSFMSEISWKGLCGCWKMILRGEGKSVILEKVIGINFMRFNVAVGGWGGVPNVFLFSQ